MFDVLVYLFENYRAPQNCPSRDDLVKKLSKEGFVDEDIDEAMWWLHSLAETTAQSAGLNLLSNHHTRVYLDCEIAHLGLEALSFLSHLEQAGAIFPALREIIINCAMSVPDTPISLVHFKIITLMVMWSQEVPIDHLVLGELLNAEQDLILQ